jgi:hypothetical protein
LTPRRGKTWPVVLEHVALTNKPWITGMKPFGRKLKLSEGLDTEDLRLYDEPPDEDAFLLALQDDDGGDDLATAAGTGSESAQPITWDHEDSPNWLRQQVCQILDEARAEKLKARRTTAGLQNSYIYESPPYYRCIEAKPGKALISDGYGDDSNFWVADISVADGAVTLSDFTTWEKAKKVFVPDDRPDPSAGNEPLDEEGSTTSSSADNLSRLQLAQEARRKRARPETETTTTPLGGGQKMASEGANGTIELSEEARREVEGLKARLEAEQQKNEKLSQTVDRLSGSVNKSTVDEYISELKAADFDEDHGFGGVLTVVRDLMLADDGEPAVQSESFSDDSNSTGELTLSDAIRRIFGAFKRTDEGKLALGESLSEPADPEGEQGGKSEEGTKAAVPAGKPAQEGEGTEELSTEKKVEKIVAESPEVARVLGRPVTANEPAAPEAAASKGGSV